MAYSILQPCNNNFDIHPNDDIDPDIHFFSQAKQITCKYVTEDEINDFTQLNSVDKLSFLQINCRSLNKNFDGVINLLSTFNDKPTCVAVTETWLNSTNHNLFHLPGYEFISSYREKRRGGGAGIFIAQKLTYKVINLNIDVKNFEYILVEIIQPNCKNIIIGAIYRPPELKVTDFNLEFDIFLGSLDCRKPIFLVGDYNMDLLKSNVSNEIDNFIKNINSHCFLPTIDKPTRITKTSKTLLDNFFINSHCYYSRSAIIFNDLSDHCPILLIVDLKINKSSLPNFFFKRFYTKHKISMFQEALHIEDWREICQKANESRNPNEAYNLFITTFTHLYNVFFPLNKVNSNDKSSISHPWMTEGLKKFCLKKSKLYKKYIKTHSSSSLKQYKTYRNLLKTLLTKAEKTYYTKKIMHEGKNSRQLWKSINELLQNKIKPNIPSSLIENNIRYTDSEKIAEKFNDFFQYWIESSIRNKGSGRNL